MRKSLAVMGATAFASAAVVFGVVSPVQAAPSSCGSYNYTANWVGRSCNSGSGSFRVGANCIVPGTGGQSTFSWGAWAYGTPNTAYKNCPVGYGPVRGTAQTQTRN